MDNQKLTVLCKLIGDKVKSAMADPEQRKSFERWYEEKYGKKYVWQK